MLNMAPTTQAAMCDSPLLARGCIESDYSVGYPKLTDNISTPAPEAPIDKEHTRVQPPGIEGKESAHEHNAVTPTKQVVLSEAPSAAIRHSPTPPTLHSDAKDSSHIHDLRMLKEETLFDDDKLITSPRTTPTITPKGNLDETKLADSTPTYTCPRISDFELHTPVGRGKFGKVYLAKHTASNYICAVKIISKCQVIEQEGEGLIRRELEVHRNLAHPSILKLLSWFHDETKIYLVLEYAPGGDLHTKLRDSRKGRLDEGTTARYVAQLTEALIYLHGKNVMHRDLKPENLLLGLHGELKLADFGYSVHSVSGVRSTVCGTLDYLSPEVARLYVRRRVLKDGASDGMYTKAVDQWSLGVLTFELLTGHPPFNARSTKVIAKRIGEFEGKLRFPGHVSMPAEEFIRQLLTVDAEKRLSLETVLVHPWITGHCEKV